MRILLIEDDQELANLLVAGLSGFEFEHTSSATEGLALARTLPFAVIILDVGLADGRDAGFGLAKQLREYGLHTPILFLTARADLDSRLNGLALGGDDYLGKPFDFRELRARLYALIRRSSGYSNNRLVLGGGLELDLEAKEVMQATAPLHLTPREYALLECLALNSGRIFSREDLLDRLWTHDLSVTAKIVDVYISSLRRKVGEQRIETVRGRGYRFL
jgi:DNA-binding response OmpR family regulator